MSEYDNGVRLRVRFSQQHADALHALARSQGMGVTALLHNWLYAALDNRAHNEAPNERDINAKSTPA